MTANLRRLLFSFICVLMCLPVPVNAATTYDYDEDCYYDEVFYDKEDEASFKEYAKKIYDDFGIQFYYCYMDWHTVDWDENSYIAYSEDYARKHYDHGIIYLGFWQETFTKEDGTTHDWQYKIQPVFFYDGSWGESVDFVELDSDVGKLSTESLYNATWYEPKDITRVLYMALKSGRKVPLPDEIQEVSDEIDEQNKKNAGSEHIVDEPVVEKKSKDNNSTKETNTVLEIAKGILTVIVIGFVLIFILILIIIIVVTKYKHKKLDKEILDADIDTINDTDDLEKKYLHPKETDSRLIKKS